jgi:hypothetical protein
MQVQLTHRDLSTVLAALRFYQAQGQCEPAKRSQWMLDIASDLGKVRPLDTKEIDWLCERLNVTREEST